MWTGAQVTQGNGRWIISEITKCNDTTIIVRLYKKCGLTEVQVTHGSGLVDFIITEISLNNTLIVRKRVNHL
jgi:hypothetical protein